MSLEKAIKKTIDYAKNFGCDIDQKELIDRLISNKIYSEEEIRKNINHNLLTTKINPWKEDKVLKTKKLGFFIKNRFKNILFLGISGSVAAGHPKKNDDIDLILITKRNKLWLTRFCLRISIFVNKINHRKYGQKERKDDFCFNLWLDEEALLLPKERQTLQSANDLLMIIPIINRNNTYQKLVLKNSWVRKYLATGYSKLVNRSSIIDRRKKDKDSYLDNIINKLFFWPQYWYMRKKITVEMVNLHQAFFYK